MTLPQLNFDQDSTSDTPLVTRSLTKPPLALADGTAASVRTDYFDKMPTVISLYGDGGFIACGGVTTTDYIDKRTR